MYKYLIRQDSYRNIREEKFSTFVIYAEKLSKHDVQFSKNNQVWSANTQHIYTSSAISSHTLNKVVVNSLWQYLYKCMNWKIYRILKDGWCHSTVHSGELEIRWVELRSCCSFIWWISSPSRKPSLSFASCGFTLSFIKWNCRLTAPRKSFIIY